MISVIYIERINSIAHQSMKISKWIISLIFLILDIVAYLNVRSRISKVCVVEIVVAQSGIGICLCAV